METIRIEELEFVLDQPLQIALNKNGFIDFRIHPAFRGNSFPPTMTGQRSTLAHFWQVPAEQELKDVPRLMAERVLREPLDIREVIAIGSTQKKEKVDLTVFAPQITGSDRKFLRILRYPGWTGLGFLISGFDSDDENLQDLNMVGFSTP
ncbi:MAG: hypothetical protein V4481_01535 [Patescibacteria group bacterium]